VDRFATTIQVDKVRECIAVAYPLTSPHRDGLGVERMDQALSRDDAFATALATFISNIATSDVPATWASYLASTTLVALLKKNAEDIHALLELLGPDFFLPIHPLAMACVFVKLASLKADKDEEHAKMRAERRANEELIHIEQVLEAAKDDNKRLLASLNHVRQVAQQISDIEADRLSTLAKAAAKEARKAMALIASGSGPRTMGHTMHADTPTTFGTTSTPRRAPTTPVAALSPVGASTHPQVNTPVMARTPTLPTTCAGSASSDRESRRSEEPPRAKPARSPLGKMHNTDSVPKYKEARKS